MKQSNHVKFAFALLMMAGGSAMVQASEVSLNARVGAIEAPQEHISEEETQQLWNTIQSNIRALGAQQRLDRAQADIQVRFAWPTRSAPGRPEFFDHLISNYIDHNSTPNAVRDFNCGSRTYDTASIDGGHKGTDISSGFASFYKMDTEQLLVVAAAAGTIVAKDDSQPDRSCGNLTSVLSSTTLKNNVIAIRHADGSVAIYLHVKTGSLTPKLIGDTVAEGEYLGVVGSAGVSTAPHLHFAVRDASNAVIDPWLGSCNPTTAVSLWKAQQAYYVQEIMSLLPSNVAPDTANMSTACNNNVAVNKPASGYLQADFYARPGIPHYFTAFVRDTQSTDQVTLRLKRPDGSQYASTAVSMGARLASAYAYYSAVISASEPGGTWTFEASYAGKTKSVSFYFNQTAPAVARIYDFYNADLNHYFRTSSSSEAASLTPASGFVPTGDDFMAMSASAEVSGSATVCRFYGSMSPGPNSHFYTADPIECAMLKNIQAATPATSPRWNFESISFAAHLPVNGVCPAQAPFPIYRAYNGHAGETIDGKRKDSNHRMTSLSSLYYSMLGKGWRGEGVVMCAISKP